MILKIVIKNVLSLIFELTCVKY